jgi:hypothetical protein
MNTYLNHKVFISLSRAMNFALEMSGAIATGSISPEAIEQFGETFGGMLGVFL